MGKPKKTFRELFGRGPTLLQGLTRFRTKKVQLAAITDYAANNIVASGLPDGHLVCSSLNCGSPFFHFETDTYAEKARVVCVKCGEEVPMVFPPGVNFKGMSGQFSCKKHPSGEVAVIKCDDTLCIGCRWCNSEIQIDVTERSKGGVILPG